MIPRFSRQAGLQVSTPGLAGFGDQAWGQVGQTIAQGAGQWRQDLAQAHAQQQRTATGLAYLRGARSFDDVRLQEMQGLTGRREALRATSIDPETGQTTTGYQQEIQRFPDWLNEQFEQIAAPMGKDARDQFEAYYLQNATRWSQEFAELLKGMELDDVQKETKDLATAGRSAEAHALLLLYRDQFSAEQYDRLESQIQTDGAMADLQATAELEGWAAAQAQLSDPEYQKARGLDTAEASAVYSSLRSFVADQRAISDRQTQQLQDANAMSALADAEQGTLNLEAAQQQVLAGTLERSVYEQARKIMLAPVSQNDPEASARAFDLVADVEAGRITPREGLNQLNAMAGQLTPGFRDARIADLTDTSTLGAALRDASSQARRELVTMTDQNLTFADLMLTDDQLKQKARDQRVRQERLLDYHDTQMRQWYREHPDASEEDIYVESAKIRARLRPMTDKQQQSLLAAWDLQTVGWDVPWGFGNVTIGPMNEPPAPATGDKPRTQQMRYDTPPEIQEMIRQAMAMGMSWEEIADSEDIKPYVQEGP